MNFNTKKSVTLATHATNFHADDICATAVLKIYFKSFYPKLKVVVKRTLDQKVIDAADIVYDIGKIYDPKTLRFDHHQKGGAAVRENGVQYAAFGLVWKHFGYDICMCHYYSVVGKKATKAQAQRMFEIVEKRMVCHIDGMDNGQMTYKELLEDTIPLTLDGYFEMCKVAVSSKDSDIAKTNKAFDKEFFRLVPFVEGVLQNILTYAVYKERDESQALKLYTKSKDKRIIICDRFYYFNFGKLPEPLVIVYPNPRGGWGAKVVRKDESSYDARFYFPQSWAGLTDAELEKESGVVGANFCHNARFLVTADSKKSVLELVDKAFAIQGI
ncbi:MAG: MYG1 family protein [Patescibacteria group bacterium]